MRKVLFILGQLTDDDVEWLAKTGHRRKVPSGGVLIEEGKALESLYFLLDGHMNVSVRGVGTVANLSSGEIMGEISLIDSRPPSATVIADGDCVVLDIARDDLNVRLNADPAFAARFYKAVATFLSDRLRGTVRRIGFGAGSAQLSDDEELEGELDILVLDNIHLAGARFDRLLKSLNGE
jgi:CRP/FNR family cyclic AMP-dependent transcriptional regulator